MQQSWLAVSLAAAALALVGNALEVKLTSPNPSTVWTTRSDVILLWQTTGSNPKNISKVDFDLMIGPDDGVLIDNISFGVPAFQGDAEWIVDSALASRNDYFVRITSADDPTFKINGPRFTIRRNATVKGLNNAGPSRPKPSMPRLWEGVFVAFVALFIL